MLHSFSTRGESSEASAGYKRATLAGSAGRKGTSFSESLRSDLIGCSLLKTEQLLDVCFCVTTAPSSEKADFFFMLKQERN